MTRPKLVVNADDLGLSPEVNDGILMAVTHGIVTAVELLVNPPFSVDLQPFLQAKISIGLHLNLCLGRPCSDLSSGRKRSSDDLSIVQANGFFCHDLEMVLANLEMEEARHEIGQQVERFVSLVGRFPDHLTFHKHLHARDQRLLLLVAEVGREHGIPVRALNATMRATLRENLVQVNDSFLGDVKPSPYWTPARLETALGEMKPGVTELMCHPGKMMRPIPGVWYLQEREIELETLTSANARTLASRFDLVNFSQAFSRE